MKNISDWETFIKNHKTMAHKLPENEKKAVLDFLKGQDVDCVAAGYTDDEISGEMTNIPLCSYEYKDFYWDSRDILYFEKYDMPLQTEFLDIVLNS